MAGKCGKKPLYSYEEAFRHLNRVMRNSPGSTGRIYPCPSCHAHHITKSPAFVGLAKPQGRGKRRVA